MAATLRFHGRLRALLPHAGRPPGDDPVERQASDERSVKDAIEACGIPHTEIDLILVGGQSAGFSHRIREGQRIDVYGLDRPPALAALPGLAPALPEVPTFVLDGHLGRLARYLRLLGFDTWYRPDAGDDELARIAAGEDRILLSRDHGLLKRSIVRQGYLVRADDPAAQLDEVVARYELRSRVHSFSRCLRCNGRIEPVSKAEVLDELREQPRTLRYFDEFGRCDTCRSIYWEGSHFERMRRVLEDALSAPADSGARGSAGNSE